MYFSWNRWSCILLAFSANLLHNHKVKQYIFKIHLCYELLNCYFHLPLIFAFLNIFATTSCHCCLSKWQRCRSGNCKTDEQITYNTSPIHFPNFQTKLSPVSSLWELSNHFKPFFTTHTVALVSAPFTAPVLPENECYSSAFLPVSHMTLHKSHWSFSFFLSRYRFPHLSFTGHRILSLSFTEIPCRKDRMATLFSHSASRPSLWPVTVVSEAMPELDVEIYMEDEHLLLFFSKKIF